MPQFTANFELSGINGVNGFKLGGASGDYPGYSVSSGGDFNGEGFVDLIIGSPLSEIPGGNCYVVFGKESGFSEDVDLAALDGSDGFRIIMGQDGLVFGYSVSTAGDFNGDGFDDLIIGNPYDEGSAYVGFGGASGFTADIYASSIGISGPGGFFFNDAGSSFQKIGQSVASAGDINGDGLDDIAIGAPYAGSDGACYIVFGTRAYGPGSEWPEWIHSMATPVSR